MNVGRGQIEAYINFAGLGPTILSGLEPIQTEIKISSLEFISTSTRKNLLGHVAAIVCHYRFHVKHYQSIFEGRQSCSSNRPLRNERREFTITK